MNAFISANAAAIACCFSKALSSRNSISSLTVVFCGKSSFTTSNFLMRPSAMTSSSLISINFAVAFEKFLGVADALMILSA